MNKYLMIENNGLISENALILLGATTKDGDDSKIGHFGSGFKYALAYFVRNNISIRIFSGEEEIKLTTEEIDFRGQKFKVLFINNHKTSITSGFGPDWEAWYAVREVYANALDEGDALIKSCNDINCDVNKTRIFIKMTKEIEEIYTNIDRYFAINRHPVYEHNGFKIYNKISKKSIIYRKGIAVQEVNNGQFDYDFDALKITESRVPAYSWTVPEAMYQQMAKCTKPYFIEKYIGYFYVEGTIESGITGNCISTYYKPNEHWAEVLKTKIIMAPNEYLIADGLSKKRAVIVPKKLIDTLKTTPYSNKLTFFSGLSTPNGESYKIAEIAPQHVEKLATTLNIMSNMNLAINKEVDIVEFSSSSVLGSIDKENNKILISKKAIETYGIHEICEILFEEYIHLVHDVSDNSREMQDVLFKTIISYAASAHGITI